MSQCEPPVDLKKGAAARRGCAGTGERFFQLWIQVQINGVEPVDSLKNRKGFLTSRALGVTP